MFFILNRFNLDITLPIIMNDYSSILFRNIFDNIQTLNALECFCPMELAVLEKTV